MSDLISRQAVIELCDWYEHEYSEVENYFHKFSEELKELPSAQPEIVRCKDCKFGNISSMGHLAVCGHEKGLVDPVPNSYCSYAERRTNEQI